jgi:hypothetical protein
LVLDLTNWEKRAFQPDEATMGHVTHIDNYGLASGSTKLTKPVDILFAVAGRIFKSGLEKSDLLVIGHLPRELVIDNK